jgi:hypothetical protein
LKNLKTLLLILLIFHFQTALGQIRKADCETFVRTITIEADSLPPDNWFENEHKTIGKIGNSVYDFEIRYYLTTSLILNRQVIIINCTPKGLKARKINYLYNPDTTAKERITKIVITDLLPRHSWEAFFDSLHSMNFFAFPSMEEMRPRMKKIKTLAGGYVVEQITLITDGEDHTYQVKVGSKIRTFSYHSPLAWYKTYNDIEELKTADQISNHFVNNLIEKRKKRR